MLSRIVGTSDYYYDSCGNIYHNDKISTFKINNSGYFQCNIKAKHKTFRFVHRAIAESAHVCENDLFIVNHKDGNKLNNAPSNLEWVSYSENIKHAYTNKLIKRVYGEEHHASVLSDADRINIIKLIIDGASNLSIASLYPLHPRYVSLVRTKKRWVNLWNTYFQGCVVNKSHSPRADDYYQKRSNMGNLSQKVRLEIIDLISTTSLNNTEVASLYKTDASNISRARHRKLWMYEWGIYDKTRTTIPEMGVEHKPMVLETV